MIKLNAIQVRSTNTGIASSFSQNCHSSTIVAMVTILNLKRGHVREGAGGGGGGKGVSKLRGIYTPFMGKHDNEGYLV